MWKEISMKMDENSHSMVVIEEKNQLAFMGFAYTRIFLKDSRNLT